MSKWLRNMTKAQSWFISNGQMEIRKQEVDSVKPFWDVNFETFVKILEVKILLPFEIKVLFFRKL